MRSISDLSTMRHPVAECVTRSIRTGPKGKIKVSESLHDNLRLIVSHTTGTYLAALRQSALVGSHIILQSLSNTMGIEGDIKGQRERERERRLNAFIESEYHRTGLRLTWKQAIDKLTDAGLKLAEYGNGKLPSAFDVKEETEADTRMAG